MPSAMASWIAWSSPAREWNAQFHDTLSRAASSVQGLAEQVEKDLQKTRGKLQRRVERAERELQQTGEHLRAQAQSLAEQAEANAAEARAVLMARASGLGLVSTDGGSADLEEELLRRFEVDARSMNTAACTGSAPSGDTGTEATVEFAAEVLTDWESRVLCGWEANLNGCGARRKAQPAALRALLRSRALDAALETLARTPLGIVALRCAAGFGHENAIAAAAGRPLRTLLVHTSQASPDLLVRLLMLLADAATACLEDDQSEEEDEQADVSGEGPNEGCASAEALRLALSLLLATLTEGSEAALREHSELQQRAEQALSAESSFVAPAETADEATCGSTAHAAAERAWGQGLGAAAARGHEFRRLLALCAELASARPPGEIAAVAAAARVPLEASAGCILEGRAEAEQWMRALEADQARLAGVGQRLEEQLSTSTRGFETELATLQREQLDAHGRVAELSRERDELQARLQALEEHISSAVASCEDIAAREHQVRQSAERVATQLNQDHLTSAASEKRLAGQHRVLAEAEEVSKSVESLLAERLERVEALDGDRETLSSQQTLLAAACLEAENARAQQLEDLVSNWHDVIWGIGADALARDATRLAAFRDLHARASALVDEASDEVARLIDRAPPHPKQGSEDCENDDCDAEADADGVTGGACAASPLAEEAARAADRYQRMRHQLQADLDRLVMLEAVAAAPRPLVCAATSMGNGCSPPAKHSAHDPTMPMGLAPAVAATRESPLSPSSEESRCAIQGGSLELPAFANGEKFAAAAACAAPPNGVPNGLASVAAVEPTALADDGGI